MRTVPAVETVPPPGAFRLANGPGSEKLRKLLEGSFEEFFADEIYPILPISEIEKAYCPDNGRPTANLGTVSGMLILKHVYNLTDEELLKRLAFDQSTHHALHIGDVCDKTCRMTPKTWYNHLKRFMEHDLDAAVFNEQVMDQLARHGHAKPASRMDSCHFLTNVRARSRGGLFEDAGRTFLRELRKGFPERFADVGAELADKYLKPKFGGVFGLVKPENHARALDEVANDLFSLTVRFRDVPEISGMEIFGIMERILREQCDVIPGEGEGDPLKVELKPPKEVGSDSLRSVFDPGVTFSGHNGKGYQDQFAEVFDMKPLFDKGEPQSAPACTFRCHVEGAHRHHGEALAGGIAAAEELGAGGDVWLADTRYGSEKNYLMAREHGKRLVSPVPGKAPGERRGKAAGTGGLPDSAGRVSPRDTFDDMPACCDAGKDGGPVDGLDLPKCLACPRLARCLAADGNGGAPADGPKPLNDMRREDIRTKETRALYGRRAGGESPHGIMKNKLGMRRLRVRGERRATLAVRMIAVATILLRIVAWKRQHNAK
jgi:hypothetical protein